MDVRHLQLLRELDDRGSVTAVAAATHRTVSAVSQQLRTAQRSAGMALVEPDGRGIRLTEAGRLLAAGAVEVDTALAAVQARWDAYRNHAGGPVSIIAFPSAATLLFPSLLPAAEQAGIGLTVTDIDPSESDFADLAADHDIVIAHSLSGPRPEGTAGLAVRELTVEPLDIALSAAHPLAEGAVLRAEDVADATWIGVPEGYPFDAVLRSIGERAGRRPRVEQRVRDNRLIEALVASSNHLAILPRFTTRTTDELALRPIGDVPTSRHMSAVMRPDRARRRAVQTMLEAISDALSAHAVRPN